MSAPTFKDFTPQYDFSQWECGIQKFFCDPVQGGGLFVKPPDNNDKNRADWIPATNTTAFFTGNQSQLFQKARPRIDLAPINYSTFDNAKNVDVNCRAQIRAWNAPLEFYVLTVADYAVHMQALATTRSIIAQMQPILSNEAFLTTGLNPFLTTHELAQINDAGGPALGGTWTLDEGCFMTPLKYKAVFAVRASVWPQASS